MSINNETEIKNILNKAKDIEQANQNLAQKIIREADKNKQIKPSVLATLYLNFEQLTFKPLYISASVSIFVFILGLISGLNISLLNTPSVQPTILMTTDNITKDDNRDTSYSFLEDYEENEIFEL